MARKNAIVKTLMSVETLGAVTVVCSDKTGTLTKNEMTAVLVESADADACYVVTGVGYAPLGGSVQRRERRAADTAADGSGGAGGGGGGGGGKKRGGKGGKRGGGDGGARDAAAAATAAALQAPMDALSATDKVFIGHLRDAIVLNCDSSALVLSATGEVVKVGSATEAALVSLAKKAGADAAQSQAAHARVGELAFDSQYKFAAVVYRAFGPWRHAAASGGGGGSGEAAFDVVFVKGAADRIQAMCSHQVNPALLTSSSAPVMAAAVPYVGAPWDGKLHAMASSGLRCIGVAFACVPRRAWPGTIDVAEMLPLRFTMIGIVGILDPPRTECQASVAELQQAGIIVKMITGDHPSTALSIARTLGIASSDGTLGSASNAVITGAEMDALSDEQLGARILGCNVFARTSPENKIRIVKLLQGCMQVVSMTGDGVNDGPALRAADIGVAMGITGTAMSKEAAKIILKDDRFDTIVEAVREGRRVWTNLLKLLIFNQPVNLRKAQCRHGARAWLRHVTDDGRASVVREHGHGGHAGLGVGARAARRRHDAAAAAVDSRSPRQRPLSVALLLRRRAAHHGRARCGRTGARLPRLGDASQRAQAMNTLVIAECAYCINCRYLRSTSMRREVFTTNRLAWGCVALCVALQLFLTYVPGVQDVFSMHDGMTGYQWLITVVFAVIFFFVMEAEKAALWFVLPRFTALVRSCLGRPLSQPGGVKGAEARLDRGAFVRRTVTGGSVRFQNVTRIASHAIAAAATTTTATTEAAAKAGAKQKQ